MVELNYPLNKKGLRTAHEITQYLVKPSRDSLTNALINFSNIVREEQPSATRVIYRSHVVWLLLPDGKTISPTTGDPALTLAANTETVKKAYITYKGMFDAHHELITPIDDMVSWCYLSGATLGDLLSVVPSAWKERVIQIFKLAPDKQLGFKGAIDPKSSDLTLSILNTRHATGIANLKQIAVLSLLS